MPKGLNNGSIIRIDDTHVIVHKRYTDRQERDDRSRDIER